MKRKLRKARNKITYKRILPSGKVKETCCRGKTQSCKKKIPARKPQKVQKFGSTSPLEAFRYK